MTFCGYINYYTSHLIFLLLGSSLIELIRTLAATRWTVMIVKREYQSKKYIDDKALTHVSVCDYILNCCDKYVLI